jgi:UTP--glucose-1-phosphate uridylyltransferase
MVSDIIALTGTSKSQEIAAFQKGWFMSRSKENFEPFFRKMQTEGLPEIVINNFQYYYERLREGQTGLIPEKDIVPLGTLADIETLPLDELAGIGGEKAHKTVIIKLNGGLGTSMGMERAKSLLRVKESFSFLDIIVRQTQCLPAPVPVIFMNSFSTRNDTLDALKGYPELVNSTVPVDFLQHKVPKVDQENLDPADYPANPNLEWCPPGHGDIYPALVTSGTLDRLLETGYDYAFVSNADNLGAVLEFSLLGYFVKNDFSFMMEAADRTEADKKGGHLAQLKSGRYVLREIAQCPDEDMEAFQDIHRHNYFNTNNIWIKLPAFKGIMDKKNGVLGLPMIRNRKTLDPRDSESAPVYQLETAMGAAIAVFDAAGAIRVPRTRFSPVKNTNDLLAVRSDCHVLNDKFQIVSNPDRKLGQILIDLDPRYYKMIDEFEERFPFGPPSLVRCMSLTVKGDFTFGNGVTLLGEVALRNDKNRTFEIGEHCKIQGEFRV